MVTCLGPLIRLLAVTAVIATAVGPGGCVSAGRLYVTPGSTWRYLDDGSDPGVAWRSLDFDDSGWSSGPGPLGYGDGDEATVIGFGPDPAAKHLTTYFRHTFRAGDPSGISDLRLRLLRDDGAVVYLNGVEVARSNMPAGEAYHDTPASAGVSGTSEIVFIETPIDPAQLAAGLNVLAVEVHQISIVTSDASFDLSLRGRDGGPFVTRGPYLQSGTPDAVTVCWRTNTATHGCVYWGTEPGRLANTVCASEPSAQTATTEHAVRIEGLRPETSYYYGVGTLDDVLAGGDRDHLFKTSPPVGARTPTRVWVIGDSGTANADAAAVRDAFLRFAGARRPDVWLMLGDNAYENGTDAEHQAAVFDMYPGILRRTVLWPTLGNHDGREPHSSTQSGVYYDIFSLPRRGEAGGLASGTEAYYSFDHGNVHFVCLDSHDTDRATSGPMLTWLAADLEATLADWVIAYWHHPPYTKGSHDSDDVRDSRARLVEMRENALPILEAGGVDLVLTGHSHSYERSVLIDGHYGMSDTLSASMIVDGGDGRVDGDGAYAKPPAPAAHRGAVYVVAGSSGKISGGPLDHPIMFVSLNTLGSLVLDIDGDRLDATFVDGEGAVRDEFALRKGAGSRVEAGAE